MASLQRLRGLLRKEFLQILRDPSALAIAFLLPAVLLFIFGDGVSMDARNIPLAVVVQQPSALASSFTSQFEQSPFFRPQHYLTIQAAEKAMTARTVQAIVWLPSDFARKAEASGQFADRRHRQRRRCQQCPHRRRLCPAGVVELARQCAPRPPARAPPLPIAVERQVRFNPAVNSRNYLVPGLIAVIMTLTGALLTALVIAREWERGTMEALMVTRVTMREILLAKLIPYFLLGMGGMAASVTMAVFLFGVPLQRLDCRADGGVGPVHAGGAGHGTV